MSEKFHAGEIVNVTFQGVAIASVDAVPDDYTWLQIQVGGREVGFAAEAKGVNIARVTPAEGEPKPGDVWHDRDGDPWFGARHFPDYDDSADCKGMNGDGWRTVLVPDRLGEQGSPMRSEDVNRLHGPLTLAYRPAPKSAKNSLTPA